MSAGVTPVVSIGNVVSRKRTGDSFTTGERVARQGVRSVGCGTHVLGARTNELVVAGGFEGVGDPSGSPAEGKHGRRRIGRETRGLGQNDEARIEGGLEPQLLADDVDELFDFWSEAADPPSPVDEFCPAWITIGIERVAETRERALR